MKRFDDELLVEVFEGMRAPGGRKLSAEAWAALKRTEVRTPSVGGPAIGRASEPAAAGAGAAARRTAAEPTGCGAENAGAVTVDPRLAEALGWHRASYE